MKPIFLNFVASLIICFYLVSCAGVKIYKDEDMKTEAGIKYYHSKPFLLIERFPQKDVAQKVSVIYLPDLAHPYFVKIKNGIGSNDLKIAFEEDSISSFGLVTDTKIPETITSLTGLLKTETADEKVSASNESQINNKQNMNFSK